MQSTVSLARVCVNVDTSHIYGTIFIIILRSEVFGKHTKPTKKQQPTKNPHTTGKDNQKTGEALSCFCG